MHWCIPLLVEPQYGNGILLLPHRTVKRNYSTNQWSCGSRTMEHRKQTIMCGNVNTSQIWIFNANSSHCISVYHHEWRGSNLGAVEHDRSQFSWHLQYSSHLRQTSLKVGKCLKMNMLRPRFHSSFARCLLLKLRQVLPHSGHHVQNQTCPLGRGSLCCRQDGDICMYKKVEGSGTMCL